MPPDWKKVGRNSKNKGRAYERRIADALGWQRVPFSGASRDWGEGDVIDCYYSKNGYWRGECKKQPARKSGDIVIDQKWIEQIDAVKDKTRLNVIFTQEHASPTTFVILPPDAFKYMCMSAEIEASLVPLIHVISQGNSGGGFKMLRVELDKYEHSVCKVLHKEEMWLVMRLPVFKNLVDRYELDCQEE